MRASILVVSMSESFQEYCWIHDFEIDFQKKVSLQNAELSRL